MVKSLFSLILILFGLILLFVNVAFFVHYLSTQKEKTEHLENRIRLGMQFVYENPPDLQERLSHLHLEQLHTNTIPFQQGKVVGGDPFHRVYMYEGEYYALGMYPKAFPHQHEGMRPPPPPHMLGEMRPLPPLMPHPTNEPLVILHDKGEHTQTLFFLLWISVVGVISFLFVVIVQKLLPLKNLKHAIVSLRNGDDTVAIDVKGDDEIAQVAQEFQKTVLSLHDVKEARTLFLRNILHELNTPILKGKLLTEMVDPLETQEGLSRVFRRLEVVLNELVMIERFSSKTVSLSLKRYRIIDILDHARDLLLRENFHFDIHADLEDQWIDVDFDLFATALKNLLDNALKYTQGEVTVHVITKKISIINQSPPLPQSAQRFDRPFNRTFENATGGLGLGLYIAYEIFKRHGYVMRYTYLNGNVIFTVEWA